MSKDRRSRPLWGRRISCWAGLLAAVTMTAAGCSGQQSVAHPDSQSSTVKVDPAHAALLRLPDGLTIRVPAGAVTRPGALSATVKGVPPVAAPSGMELTGPIYDLHLTGTTLRGDVTLSVPAPGPRQFGRTAGPDAALLAYFDPAGSWEPVNATYNAVTHVLTATTPHLSVWSVLRLNAASVLAAATDLLKGFFGKAGTGQPSCPLNAELAALRVQVTSDAGDLVKWCADDSGGQALIRIASNRSDALEADYPSNWLASRPMQPDPITGEILKILPTVSLKVSGPGLRTVLIPGGQQVNVVPQAGTSAYVLITPGVEGIFVDALLYAADTLAMTYDDIPNVPKANESATAKALASAFENTRCLAEMDAVVQNPDISTPQAAGGIFRTFADIALGCTADTWASAYGLTGVEAAFAASTFLWLVNGIKLVFDDLQALIDTAVYWQGYHIDVRWSPQTSRPTPSPQPSKSPVLTPTTEPPGQSPTPSPPVTSTAPPPVTTTVQVTVPANGGWVDTGLRVDPSHYVTINASGSWSPDGVNYTGPDGFLYSLESADNYYNTNDLGVCATCATTDYPFWAELISYTGSAPPEPGSYTSTTVASQAKLIDGVGHSFQGPWPYTGELWLGFNDDAYSGNTSDNRGEVTATITIRHS